jgi:hypothetical protein
LPGFGDEDAFEVLEALPEPIALYGEQLDLLDFEARERFMGANTAEWFARMGSPL